ncbi:hypothetical protein ACJ72_03578 [Emergomyces africanus]|uniref:Uncharacterized protein n=1 Tax=Emergomyces africanus TaxID=1955775 RepID=A0A1B7NZ68_9EURO|nr:hypothetical protein ACJ72_03578 [Emergomyces africanus]
MSEVPICSSAVPTTALSDTSKSTTSSKQQARREKALQIKQVQEEALRSLSVDSLHVVLYLRGWITDHGPTSGIFKSSFLCVLIHIAAVPHEKNLQVDQIMKSLDGNCKFDSRNHLSRVDYEHLAEID